MGVSQIASNDANLIQTKGRSETLLFRPRRLIRLCCCCVALHHPSALPRHLFVFPQNNPIHYLANGCETDVQKCATVGGFK